MKQMQKLIIKDAYRLLKEMKFKKNINESVKRSVRVRLEVILLDEERSFTFWKENVAHKMNKTRQRQVEREFNKRIQAMKIVIHHLTPFWERQSDEPTFIIRKNYTRKD